MQQWNMLLICCQHAERKQGCAQVHSCEHEAIILAMTQIADRQSEQLCGIHLMSQSHDTSAQHGFCSCSLHRTVRRNKGAAEIKGSFSKPAA